MRLADKAEQPAINMVLDQLATAASESPRALATRGT